MLVHGRCMAAAAWSLTGCLSRELPAAHGRPRLRDNLVVETELQQGVVVVADVVSADGARACACAYACVHVHALREHV